MTKLYDMSDPIDPVLVMDDYPGAFKYPDLYTGLPREWDNAAFLQRTKDMDVDFILLWNNDCDIKAYMFDRWPLPIRDEEIN